MLPSVSSGPIGVSFCRITGPSSRPSVGRKMVSPVFVSPLMIGQLIELGPRYLGSKDGGYWIIPFFGILTRLSGANWKTYAVAPRSGPSAFIVSWASIGRRDWNLKTLSSCSDQDAF